MVDITTVGNVLLGCYRLPARVAKEVRVDESNGVKLPEGA